MDLSYTPEQEAFRAEVRAWMEANVPKQPLEHYDATREGFEAHREWERALNAATWGMVTWPVEYGGRGLDLIRWLIFEEEYYRAGAPGRVNQNGIFLLGPTLMEFGTDEQKARFLPPMAAGEEIWAGVSPCGVCRQTINEVENRFEKPITMLILCSNGHVMRIKGIANLLPLKFDDLNS